MSKLEYSFFNRDTTEVATDLLGKEIVFNSRKAIITETESYRGADDPASHAYRGSTNRSSIMFGDAGYSYVYLIYGMYHCLNIVTEAKDSPGAVLIRGVKVIDMPYSNTNGPGKLCKYFGITRKHNGFNIIQDKNFYLTEGIQIGAYDSTPRIGITAAKDKLWRFCIGPSDLKQL